ncbi:MAG: ExeA family protein, partial [Planctomycetota bacterium]
MYCDFFGLRCPPFDDVPDPRFFFPSADHEEALALLRFAATNRKGPVLLTGGLGTGKTLLCRTLLSRVHIECIPVVCTCTPGDPNGLIRRVCKALNLRLVRSGVPVEEADRLALNLRLVRSGVPVEEADRLKKHLSSRTTAQRSVVLLVLDQVENLTAADFEELVILSNLEAHGRRLVQILLVGQPRVTETLAAPQFEQLRQRMFALHNLRLLSAEEVVQYVRHRLNVVGRSDEALFDDDALALIAERSGGVPRLINQICDAALLAAYSTERKTI